MRVRRSRIEEEVEEGVKGARLVLTPARRPLALPRGLPARHHADLAGHRLPRRARDRLDLRGPLRRRASRTGSRWRSRWRSPTSSRPRCTSRSASRSRRSTRSTRPSPSRGGSRGRCSCSRRLQPVHPPAQRRLQRHPAADRHLQDRRVRRGRLARGAQGPDRPVADRRQARPGRGRDAHGRLPPARAAGAPGHDAGAGGRDRRRLRERRDRAAALRELRPHAARGHRGREPRPREGHRARQRARPAAALRGPRGLVRGARARGADRARRPSRSTTCWPTSSASAARSRS